tara:strand:+ start:337 stop:501 length:165 start_codon:yes stop_codon:yes gene_type:complete
MITDREWEIIRVCLKNAPTPYDVGKYRREVEELQKKIGMAGDTNINLTSEYPPL